MKHSTRTDFDYPELLGEHRARYFLGPTFQGNILSSEECETSSKSLFDEHHFSRKAKYSFPNFVEYYTYSSRLETFKTWSVESPSKYTLAIAGFFSLGESDKTQCYSCGLILKEWEKSDNPYKEHQKWNKDCTHLKSIY